ncbi:D-tagatose-bisphosphate aldolase, class II, non-catalytic subunit [Mesorhizobium hungaricum]|jgi:D-tagatose-bisphosphate aldolase class II non-catalytic subunit|uniref:D-tagatose-bisphosphate aldolase, class II, non-catalytic subunit n=1 Tax=Mesorhizobium hungaricum TaxID=1566387 RepID=A0A1C2E0R1_9HYPH|nr:MULTISPECIES: D-tagatose-bisphosphate aldolase, class II, non-catalytic subunit [Mesorhizobium]MBN9235460.1 D-tagatose-bisphosphate aldolase, class II, non-catalytic subunit [Mesorhizobium sp.]MDQ0331387.1 D-tagatose-1,6-bisphosphate aldolase subunit GatZ/KbaZ [Mesorhizobium sp. YL-MeA3-2017]OCX20614.1 D-tagatose-bisphosphate aldolase, class II, non-catalytic subunit [Mesorhizobium hungaricum]
MSIFIQRNRESALARLNDDRITSLPRGIASVCSAHPLVIEAVLRNGLAENTPILIEATCNQVNHEGGYTGMTPASFREFVEKIAGSVGFAVGNIIFGGDHLGPNPWKALPAEKALEKAEAMVAAYVAAGFEKIHLDTSMGCAGEPTALPDDVTATRAARLAAVAEEAAARAGVRRPLYIVGTEVPPPGGATHDLSSIEVTRPQAALQTLSVHKAAFVKAGIDTAVERMIGIVVQPGVEFDNAGVAVYRPEHARQLSAALQSMPGLVFEAHSTDYQPTEALSALVDDGFAILKVGPGLTFALREALYGLDIIADVLSDTAPKGSLATTMEAVMLENPGHWASHYPGDRKEQRLLRHFSYSDRIRYYWPDARARVAVEQLFARFDRDIPETLVSQYLSRLHSRVVTGKVMPRPRELCLAAIQEALAPYRAATCSGRHSR